MPSIIFDIRTGEFVQSFTDRVEGRAALVELRKTGASDFSMMTEETRELCEQKAAALHREYLHDIKVEKSLPPVLGNALTTEEWEASIDGLSTRLRYRAANLAAHSWCMVPDEKGIIIIGWDKKSIELFSGDTTVQDVPVPKVCHTCNFYEMSLDRNRPGGRCKLAKQFYRRLVADKNFCTAHEVGKRYE